MLQQLRSSENGNDTNKNTLKVLEICFQITKILCLQILLGSRCLHLISVVVIGENYHLLRSCQKIVRFTVYDIRMQQTYCVQVLTFEL